MQSYLKPPAWLSRYDAEALGRDALAGAILSILLIPQAMAYALLAGLPPEAGLYTALVAPALYALLGRSASVSMGPVALASLLVADAVGNAPVEPMQAAAIVAVEVGAMLLLLGSLNLGRLVNFISDPALLGFTAAAAILIAASQLPAMLGIDAARSGDLPGAFAAILAAGPVHWPTFFIGAGALVVLLLGDKFAGPLLWKLDVHPPWRMALVKAIPLIVMVGATLAAVHLAPETPRVKEPSGGLPDFGVSMREMSAWAALAIPSLVIAVVVFVTGTAIAKSLPSPEQGAIDTGREAVAIGAASVGAGLAGGYVPGISFSRSALVADSGARSPLASALAGLMVVPVVLFAGPLLGMLPKAALAALVMSAVVGLIKLREQYAVWRHSRTEAVVAAVTLLATLAMGVQFGLLVGAASCVAAFLWFSSQPRVTRIGLNEDGVYRSVDRDDVAIQSMPVLVMRIDRSLYFGNAGHCERRIDELLSRHEEAEALLFDMRAVNEVDATAIRMLNRFIEKLELRGMSVGFAAVHEPVQKALESSGRANDCTWYLTIDDGVADLQETCGGERA